MVTIFNVLGNKGWVLFRQLFETFGQFLPATFGHTDCGSNEAWQRGNVSVRGGSVTYFEQSFSMSAKFKRF